MGFFSSKPTFYCCLYKVKGTNPTTGRRKTVTVVATSSEKEKAITKKSGLLPPFEVTSGSREVTEGQLEVARKYRIKIPKDADLDDAHYIISRYREEEPAEPWFPSRALVRFAAENNVYIPKYAYHDEAIETLLYALPEKKKEINELK